MTTPKTPETLASRILALQGDLPTITKDAEGSTGAQTYRYATLTAVYEVLRPLWVKYGICVVQKPISDPEHHAAGVATVVSVDGIEEAVTSSLLLPAPKQTPQDVGKAISYARRYSLLSIFGIATEDDDAATHEDQPKAAPKRRTTRKAKAAPKTDPVPDLTTQITEVETFEGVSKTTGKPFTKFNVKTSDGHAYSTFDADLAQLASDAKDDGTSVHILSEPPTNPKWSPTLTGIVEADLIGTGADLLPEDADAYEVI